MLVPGSANNLLCLDWLMKRGFYAVFDNEECLIYDKKSKYSVLSIKILAKKMFPFIFSEFELNAFVASSDDSILRHRRFVHMNFSGLKLMQRQKMLSGLPEMLISNSNLCVPFILGKHHRAKLPVNKSWRAPKPLMLIHADICGPMEMPSLKGSKYFLIFVDGLSRMIWLSFLKEKSEALESFKHFKTVAEKES